MQRFSLMHLLIVAAVIGILAAGVSAFAAGTFPYTTGKTTVAKPIANLTALAPEKGQSGCVDTAATKGAVQGKYSSVDGYAGYSAEVYTIYSSAGVQKANPQPAIVLWYVDGVPMAVGHTFSMTNDRGNTYKRVTQLSYSSAKKRTFTSCSRRQ